MTDRERTERTEDTSHDDVEMVVLDEDDDEDDDEDVDEDEK